MVLCGATVDDILYNLKSGFKFLMGSTCVEHKCGFDNI